MKKLFLGAALALACLFSSPAAALTLCTGAASGPYSQASEIREYARPVEDNQ
ncbi:Hypothetical protein NGAL_HAMBI2605_38140 [Neorhizobium galegae bv. orientalis]|nr:Hypothetical protein NGAL_HAMBI2605_38140 [Neorhizobium galegae bv. orientalis]